MTIDPSSTRIFAAQPYPLFFATISGAQGLPLDAGVGLDVRDETVEQSMIVPPDTSSGLRPPSPQSGGGNPAGENQFW